MPPEILEAGWKAPRRVRAICTTRLGGVSTGPFAECNLGGHVGDGPEHVAENRRRLGAAIGGHDVQWLDQVHGVDVRRVDHAGPPVTADAAWTERPGVVLAVTVADCVPAVLGDVEGRVVAVAHCGWRGAVGGIVEATVAALPVGPASLHVWLGPAVCVRCYEVRDDVRDRAGGGSTFRPSGAGTWRFDLPEYVARRFGALGVREVARSGLCSRCDERFFSHRRDGVTGRNAALAWLATET